MNITQTLVIITASALITALGAGADDGAARRYEAAADFYYRNAEDARPAYGTTRPADEELLVSVNVWGEVESPGSYEVPDGTNLVELISFAGGPTKYANLGRVKLTRPGAGVINDVDIKGYLNTGALDAVPVLRPGDTVVVRRNARFAWRAFVEVVSELAVVAGTALLYIEVVNRE